MLNEVIDPVRDFDDIDSICIRRTRYFAVYRLPSLGSRLGCAASVELKARMKGKNGKRRHEWSGTILLENGSREFTLGVPWRESREEVVDGVKQLLGVVSETLLQHERSPFYLLLKS